MDPLNVFAVTFPLVEGKTNSNADAEFSHPRYLCAEQPQAEPRNSFAKMNCLLRFHCLSFCFALWRRVRLREQARLGPITALGFGQMQGDRLSTESGGFFYYLSRREPSKNDKLLQVEEEEVCGENDLLEPCLGLEDKGSGSYDLHHRLLTLLLCF